MKNRILLVSLAVLLAVSVGLIACGGEMVPETTEYNLTISSTEGGSVTTPGEGILTYNEGTVVNLVGEPEEGYRFVDWTGDVGNVGDVNEATTTITMDSNYSITANFAYGPAIPLKNPNSFVQMTIEDVDSLDPAWLYNPDGAAQVPYIYETLLFYDGEMTDQFVPVLATEWELLDDNVTYRFKIREGVKFHGGGDLAPEDVEYSLQRVMVQDTYSGPAWMFFQSLIGGDVIGLGETTFAAVDEAVEVDGDWIVFHLSDRAWALPFLQILCGSWASIVDKEWCIANGEWDGTEGDIDRVTHPQSPSDTVLFNRSNGTGPWKLEEWDPGVQIKLVRNDDYWREPAAFETIITHVVEDWTTRREALLAGDADLVQTTSRWIAWEDGELEGIEELESIADLNVYEALPAPWLIALFFNMNIASDSSYIGSGTLDGNGIPRDFFSDIDVRKGFCYAFDYETYIEDGWLGQAQQLGSPVCEGLPYFKPDTSMYSLDLAKAEEHLRAAWGGELWERGFKFTLLYYPGRLRCETACRILADNLYTINPEFQVTIQAIDLGTYFAKVRDPRDIPMFQLGWVTDYPHPDNIVVPFMASSGTFAFFQGYGDPELDELIENALKEPDPAVQQDLYYEIQERYYEDAPGIVLCQLLGRRYFTKYIVGFYDNPFFWDKPGPLYYMSKSSS